MKKKIIAAALGVSLLFSLTMSSFADGEWWRPGFDFVYYANPKIMTLDEPENVFHPNREVNRYEVADALWRFDGMPEVSNATRYRDVARGDKAVSYMSGSGVMKGTETRTFDPDGLVTREQMATILYRFVSAAGYNPEIPARAKKFADSNQISGWATGSVKWAVNAGLMTGTDEGFEPQGTLTRGQIATILMRLADLLDGKSMQVTRTEVTRIEANESRTVGKDNDKEIFVDNLGWLLRQTNSGVVECFYNADDTILICFQDGEIEIDVAGMSYDEIVEAVIYEVL